MNMLTGPGMVIMLYMMSRLTIMQGAQQQKKATKKNNNMQGIKQSKTKTAL